MINLFFSRKIYKIILLEIFPSVFKSKSSMHPFASSSEFNSKLESY